MCNPMVSISGEERIFPFPPSLSLSLPLSATFRDGVALRQMFS